MSGPLLGNYPSMRALLAFTLLLALTACSSGSVVPAPPPGSATSSHLLAPEQAHAIPIGTPAPSVAACPSRAAGASCHARRRIDTGVLPDSPHLAPAEIPGYHPADLASAYGIGSGSGSRIAIVVPYHDPHAASDLAIYRAKFGLGECTTSTGCLRFIKQDGSPGTAAADDAWSAETAIDLEMSSAVCPSCTLLVVEARTDDVSDLRAALMQAVMQHPAVASNSWSVSESVAMQAPLAHDGVAIVAGSGDSGYGLSWPASDPSTIAVGGTSLVRDRVARGWSEIAWAGSGYGCSSVFARPAWQGSTGCATRAVADVSAVADPTTGVAIYNGGWSIYGGTSVATPIVAATIALAGNGSALATAQYVYERRSALNVVSALGSPLQAGLGSPAGTTAF